MNIDIEKLKSCVTELLHEYECYVVGSWCIKGVEPNDIDVLILADSPIKLSEYRRLLLAFQRKMGYGYSSIFQMKWDNNDLQEYPHYNLKTDEHNFLYRNKLNDNEYIVLKAKMHSTMPRVGLFVDTLIRDV